MGSGLLLFLVIWLPFIEVVCHCFICITLKLGFYTPKTIYKNSNMNWLGTIIVYILIFPFSFVLAIGGFLKWLFTVGRKK